MILREQQHIVSTAYTCSLKKCTLLVFKDTFLKSPWETFAFPFSRKKREHNKSHHKARRACLTVRKRNSKCSWDSSPISVSRFRRSFNNLSMCVFNNESPFTSNIIKKK